MQPLHYVRSGGAAFTLRKERYASVALQRVLSNTQCLIHLNQTLERSPLCAVGLDNHTQRGQPVQDSLSEVVLVHFQSRTTEIQLRTQLNSKPTPLQEVNLMWRFVNVAYSKEALTGLKDRAVTVRILMCLGFLDI